MKAHLFGICLLFSFFLVSAQESQRPTTIDDYFKLRTVRDPQISPDGKWVAYDKGETSIWMISSSGGESIPMTAKGYSASNPSWSPDGKYLSFMAPKEMKMLKHKSGL